MESVGQEAEQRTNECASKEEAPEDPPTCRLCWQGMEEEDAATNPLVSPCVCSGSLKYIHLKCLQEWQHVLRSQGQFRKSRHCEICKAEIQEEVLEQAISQQKKSASPFSWPRRRLRALLHALLEAFQTPSFSLLAFRLWRTYIFCAGIYKASTAGMQGLRAGIKLGRTLVEEQSGAVVQLLAALADLLGTPAAEVLWIQLVAGVVFALASEFVYSAMLGAAGGVIYGFCSGYVGAIQHSFQFVCGNSIKLAAASSRGVLKAARWMLCGGLMTVLRLAPRTFIRIWGHVTHGSWF